MYTSVDDKMRKATFEPWTSHTQQMAATVIFGLGIKLGFGLGHTIMSKDIAKSCITVSPCVHMSSINIMMECLYGTMLVSVLLLCGVAYTHVFTAYVRLYVQLHLNGEHDPLACT
jgi:hypothetical protein